jgi:hypothetical protein
MCKSKRRELFARVKNGEQVKERIIHGELAVIPTKNVQTRINATTIKGRRSKFGPNQFSIKLGK